jgi:hypothetical protein
MGISRKEYGRTSGTVGIETAPFSFETGEQGIIKIYFPQPVTITKIRAINTKAIAASDTGTLTGANATGASTAGVITFGISDAINTEYAVTPTSNNTVAAGSYYKVTPAKTTAGGKGLVSIEYVTA